MGYSLKFLSIFIFSAYIANAQAVFAKDSKSPALQAVVIETSGVNYKSGAVFNIGDSIEIPKDGFVRIMLSSGQVIKLLGPFRQTFRSNISTTANASHKTTKTKKLFALLSKREESTTLVVRSLKPESAKNFQNWDPFTISIPFKGIFCVQPESAITLLRKGKSNGELKINIASKGQNTPVGLKAGKDVQTAWPKTLPKTGEFSMHTNGKAPWFIAYDFQIVSVKNLDAPTLLAHQCETQLIDYLSLSRE